MKFEQKPNLDELLNGYIDGELSDEQCAQVRRLIEKDTSVARLLRQIEKCRILVSSLPPAEPPAEMVSAIKGLVREKWAKGVRIDYNHQPDSGVTELAAGRGAWHLFARQVLAASVIVGLFGLLGVVVYKIVGPEDVPEITTVAAHRRQPQAGQPESVETIDDTPGAGIYSLRLMTSDFTAVNAFITKLLEESTWLRYETAGKEPGRSIYSVYCSRGGLEELMTDLTPIWSRFDSATFVVHTSDIGRYVAIEQVRPEQVADIAKKDILGERIKLANSYAVLNSVEQLTSPERMLAIDKPDYPELKTIPRPVLTSPEKRVSGLTENPADSVRVDLTIVVTGSATLTTSGLTTP